MDRVDCVHTVHVIGGLADSGLAETLQDLTRTGFVPPPPPSSAMGAALLLWVSHASKVRHSPVSWTR